MNRKEKVELICEHISSGNYVSHDNETDINGTLKIKQVMSGRDHNSDYQVWSCGRFVGDIFTKEEVESIQMAFIADRKRKERSVKEQIFDNIVI